MAPIKAELWKVIGLIVVVTVSWMPRNAEIIFAVEIIRVETEGNNQQLSIRCVESVNERRPRGRQRNE